MATALKWLRRSWWFVAPWVILSCLLYVNSVTVVRFTTGATPEPYGVIGHADLPGMLVALCRLLSMIWLGAAVIVGGFCLRRGMKVPTTIVVQAVVISAVFLVVRVPVAAWDGLLFRTAGFGRVGGELLADAAGRGDLDALKKLLARGIPVDSPDYSPWGIRAGGGDTALMTAAKARQSRSAEFLLAAGADPNHANSYGESALVRAIAAQDVEIVRMLLAHGADPCASMHMDQHDVLPEWRVPDRSIRSVAKYVGNQEVLALLPPCPGK